MDSLEVIESVQSYNESVGEVWLQAGGLVRD